MRRFALLLLPVIAVALAGCEESPTDGYVELIPDFARAGGITAAVAGSGHIPSGADDKRVFSFTAQQNANGAVSGQFTLVITASVLGSENPSITRIEVEVTCMAVAGNRAWVGGVVKSSTIPEWVGRETGWSVEDNGEGANSGDLISLTNIPGDPGLAQSVCDAQTRVPNRLVDHGNVQVREGGPGGDVFFPFHALIGTCSEVVEVEGYFHPVFQFTADRSGGFHSKGHINATGVGVGLSTGATYNWNDAINFEENFRPPQGTFTSQQSFLLVGRGDAPNLRLHSLFHVTVTPNGVANVTADNFTVECG